MSETGATPEQIERAANRVIDQNGWTENMDDHYRDLNRRIMADLARILVPPDERIVPATALPTAEELDAMRAIVADDGVPAESAEWFAAFDTLRAYLERQR